MNAAATLAPAAWADLMLGKETLPGLLASGSAIVDGGEAAVVAVLSCFDFAPAPR
jgi:hypothetical protein